MEGLPEVIGSWQLTRPGSNVYFLRGHSNIKAIVTDKTVSFGTNVPCGVNIKKIKVESVEDVEKALNDFTWPPRK